jgi:hypothetical protein
MQEALELVCRKRRIPNPKDYALLLDDKSILIPMDRTVASLQGKKELVLIQKSMLSQYGIKGTGRTTDPNGRPHFIGYFNRTYGVTASIFKRMSEVKEQHYSPVVDVTEAYKACRQFFNKHRIKWF